LRILPRRPYLDIVGHRKIWFAVSAVIIVLAGVALFTKGLNFGIDFTGGTEISIQCESGTSLEQVRAVMSRFGYGDAKIQQGEGGSFTIRTPELADEERKQVEEALATDAGMTDILEVNSVGPGWGAQVTRQALIALLVFLAAILVYISLRFEFKMAVCAIAALFHDVAVTVGVYAIVGREVTPATVIAVLTILGYSLYDTIVIFDRIKENTDLLTRQSRKTYSETVNDALNQVMARSINTSLTTLVPIIAILVFGGQTLQAFAFALFIGVLSGTYSSIFVASTLLAGWKETEPKYRAYRQRVERKRGRQDRLSEKKSAEAAGARKAGAAKPAAPGKKAEARKKPEPGPEPKPKPRQTGTGKPKPKGADAKSRTKGPGSGTTRKKRKKKKK
jgi:preprotein translocase SecF subunit